MLLRDHCINLSPFTETNFSLVIYYIDMLCNTFNVLFTEILNHNVAIHLQCDIRLGRVSTVIPSIIIAKSVPNAL